MRSKVLFAVASLAIAAFAAPVFAQSKDLSETPAGSYVMDPKHTSVVWKVSHFGLSKYAARFDKASGKVRFDTANPEKSSLEVVLDPASVSTGLPEFDGKLKGAQAFDAQKHPKIEFKSTKITRTGANTGKVLGDLTFMGVTKPVTLDVVWNGGALNPRSQKWMIGFSATGKLDRTQFGMSAWRPFVGDEVELQIETEFTRE